MDRVTRRDRPRGSETRRVETGADIRERERKQFEAELARAGITRAEAPRSLADMHGQSAGGTGSAGTRRVR